MLHMFRRSMDVSHKAHMPMGMARTPWAIASSMSFPLRTPPRFLPLPDARFLVCRQTTHNGDHQYFLFSMPSWSSDPLPATLRTWLLLPAVHQELQKLYIYLQSQQSGWLMRPPLQRVCFDLCWPSFPPQHSAAPQTPYAAAALQAVSGPLVNMPHVLRSAWSSKLTI